MHNLAELKKYQVGLRLPKHLIDDIDELTKKFSLNRTDIITEAISSYIADQKTKLFYKKFDNSCKELKGILNDKVARNNLQTLEELVDELENN